MLFMDDSVSLSHFEVEICLFDLAEFASYQMFRTKGSFSN